MICDLHFECALLLLWLGFFIAQKKNTTLPNLSQKQQLFPEGYEFHRPRGNVMVRCMYRLTLADDAMFGHQLRAHFSELEIFWDIVNSVWKLEGK